MAAKKGCQETEGGVTALDRKKPSALRMGLGILVLAGMFLVLFVFVPWLLMGKKKAIEIGTVLLWLLGLGVVAAIPVFLVNLALDRKGKLLTVIEAANFVCSLVGVFAGVYILLIGAQALWNESWKMFLIAAGASTFAIYFYIQKYDRNHPPGYQ
jgi:hypothetical protein